MVAISAQYRLGEKEYRSPTLVWKMPSRRCDGFEAMRKSSVSPPTESRPGVVRREDTWLPRRQISRPSTIRVTTRASAASPTLSFYSIPSSTTAPTAMPIPWSKIAGKNSPRCKNISKQSPPTVVFLWNPRPINSGFHRREIPRLNEGGGSALRPAPLRRAKARLFQLCPRQDSLLGRISERGRQISCVSGIPQRRADDKGSATNRSKMSEVKLILLRA